MIRIPILLLTGLLCPATLFALSSDRHELIDISAEAATIDDKAGISTYTGNVTIDQGTLHISADKVEIHFAEGNDTVTRIIASAAVDSDKLAHYEQQPDDKPLVEAQARRIVYFVDDERVQLIGDARLKQTADRSFAGQEIDYDTRLGRVDAKSDGDERVRATFQPQQN